MSDGDYFVSEKSTFIVIEGLDGSGKSTICSKLGEILNCTIYKTPSLPYNKIRTEVDSTADATARFFFYLSSVFHASAEIRAILKKNSVVCDRYIYSTICYHAVLNPEFSRFSIGDWDILRPDFVFYLSTPFEERLKRIAERENRSISDVISDRYNDNAFLSQVETEFLQFTEMIPIDTYSRSVDDIVHDIVSRIGAS